MKLVVLLFRKIQNPLLTLLFFISAYNVKAQSGTLDQSFGNAGIVTTDLLGNELAQKILVQKTGKILVMGQKNLKPFLLNYNSSGEVDNSFGENGFFSVPFDAASDFEMQGDEKIIVAGTKSNKLSLCRTTSNGIIDSSFGINGITETSLIGGGNIISLKIGKDSSIITAGKTFNTSASKFAICIVKYKKNGTVDSSFGSNGIVISNWGTISGDVTSAVSLQTDGKIVVSGFALDPLNSTNRLPFVVGRYNANGSIDNTFGTNGVVKADISGLQIGGSMVINDQGKIIISGTTYTEVPNAADVVVMQFDNSGRVDSSFGNNGKLIIDGNGTDDLSGNFALALNNEQKFFLTSRSFVFSYNPDGSINSEFNDNGKVPTPFYTNSLAIQQDGKVVIGGDKLTDIALARYYTEDILPITLSSFTATKKQNSVLLNWQTVSESNNGYFAIERSNNNSNFKELGKVNSKGNSTQAQQYSFEDNMPLNGTNYYRLKQVNKDGSSTTSKTVLIDFSKAAIIKIYPNPVKNIITIEGLTGKKTTISIIDLNGRVLATTSTNNATYSWNIKALPQGTYYLRTEADKQVNTLKFIKE